MLKSRPSVLRAVIDTNVLLSGLLWRGTPHDVLEQARSGSLHLISSPALLSELADVLTRPKFAAPLARAHITVPTLLAQLHIFLEVVHPAPLPHPVCRDPDDDEVLALALATQANVVISGDDDLLALHTFAEIPVMTAAQTLQYLKQIQQ